MQRSIVVLFVLVLAALGTALWWFSRDDATRPTVAPNAASVANEGGAVEASSGAGVPRDTTVRATQREEVASAPAAVLDDPEILAALTGFKGRVVTHGKQPVPDCGVRIYRGAMDVVLLESVDVFAAEPTLVPHYVAGETRTLPDGTFLISGVWPRAFYLMFAGIGTDAPMHQVLTHSPSPGEVVDLGDVVLPDAGVIVGTVLDDNGDPLPGALVRAADLPGTLAAFFPVERFDPDGAVLIREARAPVRVLEMPAWVKSAFEHLPIPSTRSDSEGKFRLVGVIPGSNMLATTAKGYLSDVKPSLQVRAGQVKDAGKIKLKRGEELTGRVLDDAGKPVADAEVLAGSTLSVAPIDLAQKLGNSDAEGRFQGQGFTAGKVTIAARRGRGHAWVLAEPQAILGEVTVTLPATHAAAVTVTLADGKPAKDVRFQLLTGRAGDGAVEMTVFGFVPPVDLRDRQKVVGEGQWRIENLGAGKYTLCVDAPGSATAFETFEIALADVVVALQLTLKKDFPIRVLSHEDKPIRNAAVVAESRGGKQLSDMPVHCGRTNAEGRLVIDKLLADTVRVSAEHPRWGVVHGEAKLGEELVLRMQPPGSLRGLLTENGKPPEPGKFTVAIEHQRGNGPRGPVEEVPMLVTPGLDGSFAVAALQPGTYEVHVIKALDALRSPGGFMAFAQDMSFSSDLPSEKVEVAMGQATEVRIDAGQKPIDGPTAHLFGNVTIDGKLAAGSVVTCHAERRRFTAKVDETGRFDLGTVPATVHLYVTVMGGGDVGLFGSSSSNVWSSSVTLAQAEERELTIVVNTSSISGTCHLADGSPAPGVFIQAQGRLKNAAENEGQVWLGAPTDAQGRFEFKQVAEGTWTLEAHGNGEHNGRGKLEGLVVTAGVPLESLRIDMKKSMVVKGRVDLTALGTKKAQWFWIGFHKMPKDGGAGVGDWGGSAGGDPENGEFTCDEIEAGSYRVRIHVNFGDNDQAEYHCQDLEVPPQGLDNVVLRLGAVVTR